LRILPQYNITGRKGYKQKRIENQGGEGLEPAGLQPKRMAYKVMVIEDEKNIVLGVKTCLEVADYQVFVAETGEKALDMLKADLPDIILLDLLLPGISGFQVCEQIKKSPETRHIPVIVLSAKTGEEDMRRAEEAGADAYMTKPFRPRDLWDKLKQFIPREKAES